MFFTRKLVSVGELSSSGTEKMVGGPYGPLTVNPSAVTRGRFTKFHDFVPSGICQDPVKLSKFLGGPRALGKN